VKEYVRKRTCNARPKNTDENRACSKTRGGRLLHAQRRGREGGREGEDARRRKRGWRPPFLMLSKLCRASILPLI